MNARGGFEGFVSVRGARQHNLKDVNVDIPRNALVVFTGVSGSGKSSLAFGTIYAEAQRRYLESVAPYARRLFDQMSVPEVDRIDGLPPAVALQQQRGSPTTRSSVGSVSTLSNLLRMLYSRAGEYPPGQAELHGEAFSTNSPEGACPACHGAGRVYDATEASMVPDPSLTIRERAIAAWPTAWGGQNQRDILVSMGLDVDRPWSELPAKDRNWILFTDEQPTVPVYPGYTPEQTRNALKRKEEPNYQGTFTGVKPYLLHTLATTESPLTRKRVLQYLTSAACPNCKGKRLRPEALSVTFAGFDIAEISALPLKRLRGVLEQAARVSSLVDGADQPERRIVAQRIAQDLISRIEVMLDLGLGYLALERSTPTLSPGELQRLRLATQVHSNLFGVVYVLDEPSAGLHPADIEALLRALDRLKASGNSLFVVEHEIEIVRRAEWIVDVGPLAGEEGGEILYSGPPAGLEQIKQSQTRSFLFDKVKPLPRVPRTLKQWLRLEGLSLNNLRNLSVAFPTQALTCVTGVSGSGKSSLVSQALIGLIGRALGQRSTSDDEEIDTPAMPSVIAGRIVGGMAGIRRLVQVDQKPIGRTPRSNPATYTGLFDEVRKLFAATKAAGPGNTPRGDFHSTSPKAAATSAKARDSFRLSCCLCQACMLRAQPVRALATTRRRSRSSTGARTSPMYSA